jgi:hypothetical protein
VLEIFFEDSWTSSVAAPNFSRRDCDDVTVEAAIQPGDILLPLWILKLEGLVVTVADLAAPYLSCGTADPSDTVLTPTRIQCYP